MLFKWWNILNVIVANSNSDVYISLTAFPGNFNQSIVCWKLSWIQIWLIDFIRKNDIWDILRNSIIYYVQYSQKYQSDLKKF